MAPIPERELKVVRCVWVRVVKKKQCYATNQRMLGATILQMPNAHEVAW